jgi:hypothetical protein
MISSFRCTDDVVGDEGPGVGEAGGGGSGGDFIGVVGPGAQWPSTNVKSITCHSVYAILSYHPDRKKMEKLQSTGIDLEVQHLKVEELEVQNLKVEDLAETNLEEDLKHKTIL